MTRRRLDLIRRSMRPYYNDERMSEVPSASCCWSGKQRFAAAYITVQSTALETKPAPFMSAFFSQTCILFNYDTHDDGFTGFLKLRNSSFLPATTPFANGAGHVQPNRAADPGLVYDMGTADYLRFLCALGYNSSVIGATLARPRRPRWRTSTTRQFGRMVWSDGARRHRVRIPLGARVADQHMTKSSFDHAKT
ncbi:uncharacterized protein [Lolium perenne]|uniref:uncharacterized protein n=1 Tax=Lolium perenne TaxID=4522 RepID=UPI0021F553B6|nr:subtilisin-like protease SBT1.6 [Lolium perenne]